MKQNNKHMDFNNMMQWVNRFYRYESLGAKIT
jgi:hypothetical protein